jgi:hypothetical protein
MPRKSLFYVFNRINFCRRNIAGLTFPLRAQPTAFFVLFCLRVLTRIKRGDNDGVYPVTFARSDGPD